MRVGDDRELVIIVMTLTNIYDLLKDDYANLRKSRKKRNDRGIHLLLSFYEEVQALERQAKALAEDLEATVGEQQARAILEGICY